VRESVGFVGAGNLPLVFAVTDLAVASVGAAAAALVELVAARVSRPPAAQVDRRLASMWFALLLRPRGWSVPSVWDSIAGDYPTIDGWVRLHTSAPITAP